MCGAVTPRIRNVSPVARDNVNVEMRDRLSSGIPGVKTDVVAVRGVLQVDVLLDFLDQCEEFAALRLGCLPPGRHHTPGNDESVTWANRKTVPDRER